MRFELDATMLSGFLVALARASAWVFTSPPFSGRSMPARVKIGLAAALTLALGPQLATLAVPLEVGPLIAAVVLQVLAGVMLGFLVTIFFSIAQAAGGLIDVAGGFGMSQVLDPQTSVVTTVFGRFYNLLAVTLLFVTGGHLLLVRGFLTSFEAIPMTDLSLEALGRVFSESLGLFLVGALEIALPLLAVLFLADLATGLLTKAAPAMNVFLLALPVKIMLTLGLAGVAITTLPGAISSLVEQALSHGMRLVGE
jgi:flagellar biosynthetic protein FliR